MQRHSSPPAVRVASVPARHVYVRHLADPAGADGVTRLEDVVAPGAVRAPHGWYPPGMLDPDWARRSADAFDVFHVHFGFDGRTAAELHALADALDEADVPLVLTVHDLRNPHHPDPGLHDAQLAALIGRAAAVVTLTPGAARAITRRSGRLAAVLRHPHVVPLERLGRPRPDRDGFVVGLHAKSVRPNMDVTGVASVLADVVPQLPGASLRLDLHDEVLDPASCHHQPALADHLRELTTRPGVELRVHPYFTDADLWDYLQAIDASVLPYRFGTHSGWLEACHDVGTAVLAPSCGFYAEQQPCHSFGLDEDGLDTDSLAAAVVAAHATWAAGRVPQADAATRRAERLGLAAAHRALYERVMAGDTTAYERAA
ncbi:hypothetical protein DSM112329_01979 [Paraconexibacter sp. AEG42_29]|uniref:Glycosyltransferase subfamily 4-like N-terminal domain-containing protein n=1 Tax=Paraconexibacter sp. AEG42_29 TaxID=2997339 RepID=A0AAU7AU22_9ACTN